MLGHPTLIANRYEIERSLGSGGMGTVYLAKDRFLDGSLVAIKVLHPGLTNDPAFVSRFLREMQTMRQVNHRNVVRIFDTGEYESTFYYSMEFLSGESLSDIVDALEEGQFIPWERADKICKQLLSGLSAIHEAKIVHRDLKPDNILILEQDITKIADFGVVRTADSKLTQTSAILGTVEYIAPEIWNGDVPSFRSDIYALGLVLFELLTGNYPFRAENPAQMLKLHLSAAPPPLGLHRSDLPFWVNPCLQKMLAKRPEDRPKTVASILRLFENPPKRPSKTQPVHEPEPVDTLDDRLRGVTSSNRPPTPAPTGAGQRNAFGSGKSTIERLEFAKPKEEETAPRRRSGEYSKPNSDGFPMFPFATATILCIFALIAFTGYPQNLEWVQYRVLKMYPDKKPAVSDERSCVEQFVGAFQEKHDTPDQIAADFEVFTRQISILVPEAGLPLKQESLPDERAELLFVGVGALPAATATPTPPPENGNPRGASKSKK